MVSVFSLCDFFFLSFFLARKQFPKRKLDSRRDGEREKEEEGKETEGGQESKRAKIEGFSEKMGETCQKRSLWLFMSNSKKQVFLDIDFAIRKNVRVRVGVYLGKQYFLKDFFHQQGKRFCYTWVVHPCSMPVVGVNIIG